MPCLAGFRPIKPCDDYASNSSSIFFFYCLSNEGDITVNKLLEGSSTIKCKSLAAQMINGEAVSLSATNFINVKAMYSQESSVSAIKGDITVGLMQGNTKVRKMFTINVIFFLFLQICLSGNPTS